MMATSSHYLFDLNLWSILILIHSLHAALSHAVLQGEREGLHPLLLLLSLSSHINLRWQSFINHCHAPVPCAPGPGNRQRSPNCASKRKTTRGEFKACLAWKYLKALRNANALQHRKIHVVRWYFWISLLSLLVNVLSSFAHCQR